MGSRLSFFFLFNFIHILAWYDFSGAFSLLWVLFVFGLVLGHFHNLSLDLGRFRHGSFLKLESVTNSPQSLLKCFFAGSFNIEALLCQSVDFHIIIVVKPRVFRLSGYSCWLVSSVSEDTIEARL